MFIVLRFQIENSGCNRAIIFFKVRWCLEMCLHPTDPYIGGGEVWDLTVVGHVLRCKMKWLTGTVCFPRFLKIQE